MKRLLSIFLAVFIISGLSFNSLAAVNITDNSLNSTVEYFEDGSYIETIIVTDIDSSLYATNTISGHKTVTYKDSTDVVLWSATINGSFSYNGSSATCTSASITYNIFDSAWKISSASVTKTGNKAIGNVLAKRYFLGVCTRNIEKTFTLSCSASGSLS